MTVLVTGRAYIGGLNNYGQVLLDRRETALWTPTIPNGTDGALTAIPLPPNDIEGDALWLNDYGQVATSSYDVRNNVQYNHVSLWIPESKNGTAGSLSVIGHDGYDVEALNSYGQILGHVYPNHGFIWTPKHQNGAAGDLVKLTDGDTGWRGMDDSGLAIGTAFSTGLFNRKNEALIWLPQASNTSKGALLTLGALGDDADSGATAISASGQVLGYSCTLEHYREEPYCKTTPHVFLWDRTHGMHDLLSLTDGWPGYELDERVVAINSAGQVVLAASDSATGGHLLLLTPHPSA
ncbi:MAG TPA: hypothetical protein VH393_11160 [Ktedonobacterales bacterium]